MFRIVKKEVLNSEVVKLVVEAPLVAKKALPGQFIIFRVDEYGERVPLTINDYDRDAGTISVIMQTVGKSTRKLANMEEGDEILDFVGPMGHASNLDGLKKVCVVGGGLGTAIALPQAKWLHQNGCDVDIIAGFRNKDIVILEDEMKQFSNRLFITTDDGSYGEKGFVSDVLKRLIEEGNDYDVVIAIGPLIMMRVVCDVTREKGVKTIVSMNTIMLDGTGMCGACRLTVNGETKFACVDGPEFDGHQVNFAEAMSRGIMFKEKERSDDEHYCNLIESARGDKKGKTNMQKEKTPMPEQEADVRNKNFNEVALGYSEAMAQNEARRCLQCKNKPCVEGCPVNVQIPEFLKEIADGNFGKAYNVIRETNALPAICGRVCPQETQCESKCVRGLKNEPVAIGRLERFAADYGMKNLKNSKPDLLPNNGHKVAVIGSGPAGLSCAGDLAKMGYQVSMFEALHTPGGVLQYGIPEFRLPKELVSREIDTLRDLGVDIKVDMVIGKVMTLQELQEDMGFEAIFVGTGAGLPNFMNMPGENLKGVYSANEFLTRINLMHAYDNEKYDTPIKVGKRAAIIGGGNVAMDAARCAKRLGADETYIVYRRSEEEMPARLEEVHHAKEEGIIFKILTNPTQVIGDDTGWVTGLECMEMELGEPDASGRRRPIAKEGSEHVIDVETVVIAIGNSPNPLIRSTTPGLEANKWGCIVASEETGKTSLDGIYAGGDTVTGAATVILAMGAGKRAAAAIDEYIKSAK